MVFVVAVLFLIIRLPAKVLKHNTDLKMNKMSSCHGTKRIFWSKFNFIFDEKSYWLAFWVNWNLILVFLSEKFNKIAQIFTDCLKNWKI